MADNKKQVKTSAYPTKLTDNNKKIFNSKELQFPPTPQSPIRQRKKMGGIG